MAGQCGDFYGPASPATSDPLLATVCPNACRFVNFACILWTPSTSRSCPAMSMPFWAKSRIRTRNIPRHSIPCINSCRIYAASTSVRPVSSSALRPNCFCRPRSSPSHRKTRSTSFIRANAAVAYRRLKNCCVSAWATICRMRFPGSLLNDLPIGVLADHLPVLELVVITPSNLYLAALPRRASQQPL